MSCFYQIPIGKHCLESLLLIDLVKKGDSRSCHLNNSPYFKYDRMRVEQKCANSPEVKSRLLSLLPPLYCNLLLCKLHCLIEEYITLMYIIFEFGLLFSFFFHDPCILKEILINALQQAAWQQGTFLTGVTRTEHKCKSCVMSPAFTLSALSLSSLIHLWLQAEWHSLYWYVNAE